MRDEPVNAKGQTRSDIIDKLKEKYGENYIWPATKKELEPLAVFHDVGKDKDRDYFARKREETHKRYSKLYEKYSKHYKNVHNVIREIARELGVKEFTVRKNLGNIGAIERVYKTVNVTALDSKGNVIIASEAGKVAEVVGLSRARVLDLSRKGGNDREGRTYHRF